MDRNSFRQAMRSENLESNPDEENLEKLVCKKIKNQRFFDVSLEKPNPE